MKTLSLTLVSLLLTTTAFAKDVSAYLRGTYVDATTAKAKLSHAGFEVIADYVSIKDGQTLVFTNAALKAEASKENRAHAAVLRMFIDSQEKSISITNPEYFGRAFMQSDYNDKVFSTQLATLNKTFNDLKGSQDKLDDDNLEGYHFMFGMPYYEDSQELAKDDVATLVQKASTHNNGKSLVFSLKLSNGSYLLGYDLGEVTKEFVSKIGRANAAVLPYSIVIEDGKATMLNAKYYLAVSYPQLTMGQFSDISEIPDAINADLTKAFQ